MVKEINQIEDFLVILKENDISVNSYMSYDYLQTLIKYKRYIGFVCFCAYTETGDLIGLLPLYRCGSRYEIVGYRDSNYLGYVCTDENLEIVDKEISEHIKSKHPGMVVEFYDINSMTKLYEILSSSKMVYKDYLYDCPYVDCNQSFDELFISQIKKSKKRAELKKFGNKVELAGNVEIVNIDDCESYLKNKDLIKYIYPLHAERFKDVYIPEDLCLHTNENYYTKLFTNMVMQEKALLSIMTVDGVVVSFLYTLVAGKVVMDWMPAFDPAFQKYNLGTVHLMKLLQYLCGNEKYKILDFSKGAAVYKARWSKGKTANYCFVRRYSKSPIAMAKAWFRILPLKLKNYLRKKGSLEKIKSLLVALKGNNKSKNEENPQQIEELNKLPDDAVVYDFAYNKIVNYPMEIRKLILNQIYEGNDIKLVLVNEHLYIYREEVEELNK